MQVKPNNNSIAKHVRRHRSLIHVLKFASHKKTR